MGLNLILAAGIYPNVYIYANLNEPLLIYTDGISFTQVCMNLFQLPKYDCAGINLNVSNCILNSMKCLYITQIE